MSDVWVISDLHLGGGPEDPLEDFRMDAVLIDFIEGLDRGSTLVLNGDFIEFAQTAPHPEPDALRSIPDDRLWPSELSVAKLATVVRAHDEVFNALGRHISDKAGRVVVTIGNHDLDLVFPDVQTRFATALGAPPSNQLTFVVGGFAYDDVVIQHGHQATPENCPVDPDHFTHLLKTDDGEKEYLERVWGTDFVLSWYNDFELSHPYADNVKPTLWALYRSLRARPRLVGFKDLLRLLAFLKRRGLPPDVRGALLAADAAIDPAMLVGGVATAAWQELLVDATRDELDEAVDLLTPDDRAALARGPVVALPDPEQVDGDEGAVLGLGGHSREKDAATKLIRAGANIVVFGHTHKIVDSELGSAWYNPGCWIPRLNLDDPHVDERFRQIGFCDELLRDHTLYKSLLRAVLVRPGATKSRAELRTIHDEPAPPVHPSA